ncbi:MAG: hypothetical protein KDE53_06840, partial [Caldilineaceae bacterium]|nr:hypothetical protein [Caldilineaceae bacterium]
PTVMVVSAQTAAETLAAGHSVLSTWAMAPTLHAELPAELAVTSVAVDPNWIRFMQTDDTGDGPPQMSRPDHGMGVWMGVGEASADDRLSAEQLLQQPLLPTVTLHRYRVQDTPHSPLAAYREPIADAEGVDLFLLWQVAEGAWPADVAISVRLTAAGAVIEGAQIDRNRPATGLNVPGGDYLSDPYHFALTAEAKAAVDGALIILYRPTDGGFVNVAQLALAW